MMKQKRSFILYYDFEEQTAAMTDAQVGRLIRVLMAYELRGEVPDGEEPAVMMSFYFMKPVMDVNRAKYEKMWERNRINGAKAAAKKDYLEK